MTEKKYSELTALSMNLSISMHRCGTDPTGFTGSHVSNLAPGALIFDFIPYPWQQTLGHKK
jgi:hypothetical protein